MKLKEHQKINRAVSIYKKLETALLLASGGYIRLDSLYPLPFNKDGG